MRLNRPQGSPAVGSTHVTTSEQLPGANVTEMSAGTPAKTGGSMSSTVTSKLAETVLLFRSVAV